MTSQHRNPVSIMITIKIKNPSIPTIYTRRLTRYPFLWTLFPLDMLTRILLLLCLCLPLASCAGLPEKDQMADPAVVQDEGTGSRQSVRFVDDLKLVPGFRAELLYTVPKEQQGSWISIAEDPKRRLVVCDQFGSLYRIWPGRGEKQTMVQRLATPVGKAHGLLFAFDSLYVVGEGPEGQGLYRLFDTDGDDQFEKHRLLKAFAVGGEHHAHAVVLGPDNLLYIAIGNHVQVPKDVATDSPFRNYGADALLPQIPPPSGHAANVPPPGGYILRTDENGADFTILCAGFRNAYDIAFNNHRELFAYDSDMEYDSGSSWYRPTRLNHAIPGADFGWRHGSGKWPAYYADSFGSVIDIGQGSPAGITFGYGAKFPARYQNAMFLNDWTYGRIRAVHLIPHGASYRATAEDFVVGRPLPLTDSVIGSDGALYFLVGGRKTQSKLFRVTYAGRESTRPKAPPDHPQARAARMLRRRLEGLQWNVGQRGVELAWPYLDSPDRAIRHAARIAVEHQPLDLWKQKTLDENRPQALATAMVALARWGHPSLLPEAIGSLQRLDFASLPSGQAVEILRAYGLLFIRMGRLSSELTVELRDSLEAVFPTGDMHTNRELARLLVYLNSDQVAGHSVSLVRSSRLQEDQMFHASVLRLVDRGWTRADRQHYFDWLNRARFSLRGGAPFDAGDYFNYQGGRSFRPYIEAIRADALKRLSKQEKADTHLSAVIHAEQPPAAVSGPQLQLQRQPSTWSVADLAPLLDGVNSGRSFAVGQAAYDAVGCTRCHKLGTFAGDVSLGPDLDTAASRYSARDLLESIIEPSKVISDQHADRFIATEDGLIYTGAIIEENSRIVRIKTDPAKAATVSIPKDEIEQRGISELSRMPEGLLDPLTEQQILDLLAYVLSGADPEDAAFRP